MIRYELMNEAHVAQIAQLEKRCFSDPWSENSIRSELTGRLSLWVVALDGDTVAGYIGSQSVLGESDMMNVAVAPEYRRRGIAQALILELIREKISRFIMPSFAQVDIRPAELGNTAGLLGACHLAARKLG